MFVAKLISPLIRAAVVAAALAGAPAHAADPSVVAIQAYGARLVETMKSAAGANVQTRYQRLLPIMSSAFDFGTMTRLAVGPAWGSLSGGQQNALREAFTRFTCAYYANRIDGYSGERIDVDPAPVLQGGQKIVKTRLVGGGGGTQINYLMSGSRVIDIYLDGSISEVAARRAEFTSILANGGADALIKSLRTKAAALLGG